MSKKFFTVPMVRHWRRLPREAVGAPSLAVLKARLDGAWSNLGWWRVSLPMAGGWNWMSLRSLPTQTVLWFYFSLTSSKLLCIALLISKECPSMPFSSEILSHSPHTFLFN